MPFSIVSLTPIAWRAQMMHRRLLRSALCTAVCDRQLYGVHTNSFTLEQQAHLAEIAEGLLIAIFLC